MPPYLNEELLDLFVKGYFEYGSEEYAQYIHYIKTDRGICRYVFMEWYDRYLIEVKGYSPANVKTLMNL